MIPGVDTSLLHPVFRARLEHALNNPLIVGKVRVVSATRTYAEQKYLYDHRNDPGFNTAADPDSVNPGWYGLDARYGSWHMQQRDGYGYAVDLNWSELDARTAALAERILIDNRLERTVLSPQYEPWHWQMLRSDWYWTPPAEDDDMTPDEKIMLREIYRQLCGKDYKSGSIPPRPVRDPIGEIHKAVGAKAKS